MQVAIKNIGDGSNLFLVDVRLPARKHCLHVGRYVVFLRDFFYLAQCIDGLALHS